MYVSKLVGGLEHFLFSIIYGIIFPIDFHIFQDGYRTTNKKNITYIPVVCFTMMYIYIYSVINAYHNNDIAVDNIYPMIYHG